MSQLAAYVNSAVESSIRLVQDVSRPTTSSNAVQLYDQMQSTMPPSLGPATPRSEVGADTTVTTLHEVASASSLSTESRNMALRVPKIYIDAPVAAAQTSEQTIRMSRSATALKETGPHPERALYFDQIRQYRAGSPTGLGNARNKTHGATHALSESKSKLPEFQQSRRWANFQAAQTKAADRETKEQVQPSTIKESPLEQQRALAKTSLQSPRSIPPSAAKALGEADSVGQAHSLCRSLSVPTWQVKRTAHVLGPTSVPVKWVARKLSIRRHRRTTSRRSDIMSSVDLTASPRMAQLRRLRRPRKAIADLRRKAGFASSTTKLSDAERVVDLNTIVPASQPEKRSSSAVPSLHDPEKAKTFSQECEAMLSNVDFDNHWLGTDGRPLPTLKPTPGAAQASEIPRPTTSHSPPTTTSNNDTGKQRRCHAGEASIEARRVPETLHGATAPDPPKRTSSKGGPRLASLGHRTKPACIPILHGSRGGALVDHADDGECSGTIRPNQQTTIETPTRQSSTMSRHFYKGPRPIASTDTLTMIEAQVQDSAHAAIVEKLKQKTAFIVGFHKRSDTTTSMPAERPLPSLSRSIAEIGPEEEPSVLSGTTSPTEHPLKEEASCVPNHSANRKLQDIAARRGLTIDPIITGTPAIQVSPTLPTPSSTCSQTSIGSRASVRLSVPFTRHDMSRLRPDRTRSLKKRVQDDLARERRISEEFGTAPIFHDYANRPLPPIPSLERQRSIDPLDQFPSVPNSRPQSRTSLGANGASTQSQSRSRSHARHSSKGSSIRPRRARQTLGISGIKVLVSTSPLIEKLRLTEPSPKPIITDTDGARSPVKPRHGLSTSGINLHGDGKEPDRVKAISMKKLSLPSLQSQASSRPSTFIARPLWRGSIAPATDSDDDLRPQFASTRINVAGVRKLRRRWNSNDIRAMQKLQEDLAYNHEIIMRLEQELRLHREEIQKTVQVFAPISHANGLKRTEYTALQPGFVLDKNRMKAETVLSKELESINAARDRSPKAKKPKDTAAKLRPFSHISSASATTNMTMGSDERISVEGSTTDQEYDRPSSEIAPDVRNLTATWEACSSRPVRGGSTTALHQPPPVAEVLSNGKSVEKMVSGKLKLPERNHDRQKSEKRLSVNHGFTDTEQMDRAIEAFQSFA